MEGLAADDPELIGPYRLKARVGSGGMGVVYLASDPGGADVAVKLIHSSLAADRAFRARFGREVRAGQRVGGICTAHYLDADLDSPRPYLVTEYVSGGNLLDFVAEHGPLEYERLVGLAVGLAEGLVAMAAAGVIHRDLKPSNVLMAEQGPKVVDFGISHAADGTSLTQTGAIVGSPSWMAPEQAQGRESGPAVDVFSWGATVAFAATGRLPFGEGRPEAVIYRLVHEEPDLEGIDPRLAPHVKSALAKVPSARPVAADLLVGVIRTAMAGQPVPTESLEGTTELLDRTWAHPPPVRSRQRHSRRLALALAAVVLIGAAIAGAVYVAHGNATAPGHHAARLPAHTPGTTPSASTTTSATAATTTSTTAPSQSPTADVTATLQVVPCPTSYGIEPAPEPKNLPSTLSVSVPADLASQLSVYADEAGVMDVVAPTGWVCTANFGADGSGGVSVLPAGDVLPSGNSLPQGSTLEAIVATQNGGCQGCADFQACPFFAAAAQDSPATCSNTPPASESVDRLSSTVVGFMDPPGSAGNADPSGGEYPANAVVTFVTDPPGSAGNSVASWLETCTLPYSQQALCTAVLNDFAGRYADGG